MEKYRVLNRDVIKYVAMFTMLLNHIANVFLVPGTVLCETLKGIGYFTAPVMCYFLVEGYQYTHSKVEYGKRLFAFALISQVPYMLVFHVWTASMISSLLLCFLLLVIKEQVDSKYMKGMLYGYILVLSAFTDWPILAPVMVLFLAYANGNTWKMFAGYFLAFLGTGFYMMPNMAPKSFVEFTSSFGIGLLRSVAILVAAITVIYFYNGKRASLGRKFSQWFFYIFYPAHLLLLYLIKALWF